jgi:hypothetical protein
MHRIHRKSTYNIVRPSNENGEQQITSKSLYQRRSVYKTKERLRWIDNIKDILKKHGHSTAMVTHLALERKLKLKPILFTASVEYRPPRAKQ